MSGSDKTFFYVIGGEYADTTFEDLLTRTSTVKGPFDSREEAEKVWKEMSFKTTGSATAKYEVMEVLHKLPRLGLMQMSVVTQD